MSMVRDSLRSIMRSFCGEGQQIKEVFKVDTGAAQYRKSFLYNILYLQYSLTILLDEVEEIKVL